MNFIPDMQDVKQVPFFDDVTSEGGWGGHTTKRSISALKSEITASIGRLGGFVVQFQSGKFLVEGQERDGFKIRYVIESGSNSLPGEMDIAALPVKRDTRLRRSLETRKQKSIKMALYMVRQALDGLWFLQQLWPGYAGLMPGMIEASSGKTVTQLWSESSAMNNLLPPGDSVFEGEFEELS